MTATTTPCAKHSHLSHPETIALVELTPRELVPDDWYTRPTAGVGTEESRRLRWAKEACRLDCPTDIRLACLQLSLDNEEEWGVWGGYDAEERRQILAERDRRSGKVRTP